MKIQAARAGKKQTQAKYKASICEERQRNSQENVTPGTSRICSSPPSPSYDYTDDFESYTSSDTGLSGTSSTILGRVNHCTSAKSAKEHVAPNGGQMASQERGASDDDCHVYMDDRELDGMMHELKAAEDGLEFMCETEPETMVSQLKKVQNDMDVMFGTYDPVQGTEDILSVAIKEVANAQKKANTSAGLNENSKSLFALEDKENKVMMTDLPSYVPVARFAGDTSDPKDDQVQYTEPKLSPPPPTIADTAGSLILDVLRASLQKVHGYEERLCSGIVRKLTNPRPVFKPLEAQSISSESSVSVKLEKHGRLTPEPCAVLELGQSSTREIPGKVNPVAYPKEKDSSAGPLGDGSVDQSSAKGRKTGLWVQTMESSTMSDCVKNREKGQRVENPTVSEVETITLPGPSTPEVTLVVPFSTGHPQSSLYKDHCNNDDRAQHPDRPVDNKDKVELSHVYQQVSVRHKSVDMDKSPSEKLKSSSEVSESAHSDQREVETIVIAGTESDLKYNSGQKKRDPEPMFVSTQSKASSLKSASEKPLKATSKPSPESQSASKSPNKSRSPAKSPVNSKSAAKSPVSSHSAAKSNINSQSPGKSHINSQSPAKSHINSQSPAKSPINSKSQAKSPVNSQSPAKSPAPAQSPRRISLNSRSVYRSKPNHQSPKKKNASKNVGKTTLPRQRTIHAKITSPSTISAANPYEAKTVSPRHDSKYKQSKNSESGSLETKGKGAWHHDSQMSSDRKTSLKSPCGPIQQDVPSSDILLPASVPLEAWTTVREDVGHADNSDTGDLQRQKTTRQDRIEDLKSTEPETTQSLSPFSNEEVDI